jgi:hypothetical protein
MLTWLILIATATGAAILLRKLLPARWAQALGTVVFWFFAAIAAAFAGLAIWTASGILSGQVFWIIFAGVQVGGAVLFLGMGRLFRRLLVA